MGITAASIILAVCRFDTLLLQSCWPLLHFHDEKCPERDVVVTGIGMVTPLGIGREVSWRALMGGKRAGRLLQPHDIDRHDALATLLNRVPGGAPADHETLATRVRRRNDDFSNPAAIRSSLSDVVNCLQIFSVSEALEHAGVPLRQLHSDRAGCVIGSSKPSLRAIEAWSESVAAATGTPETEDPFLSSCLPDSALRSVLALTGIRGPSECPVAACATGLISVLQAASLVHSGQCDICIAGSADASLRASVVASFHRLGVTSRHPDPSTACRPFDAHRDGFIIGEGAAAFVLESRKHAAARNAPMFGQVVAGGWLTDTTGMTQIDSSGTIVARVLDQILSTTDANGGKTTRRPDFCCLHGTATRTNDLAEARGLTHVVSESIPCFGIKGSIGHLLGASGAVELAASLLTLRDGQLPPTVNFDTADPDCPVAIHREATAVNAAQGLKLSLGFGGHVAACLVSG